jgi:hypothetical protein
MVSASAFAPRHRDGVLTDVARGVVVRADGFGTAADAFDPIKQKSLVESSFDLSVGNFFTEEEVRRR